MEPRLKYWPPKDFHPDNPVEPHVVVPASECVTFTEYVDFDISRLRERIRFFPVIVGPRAPGQTDAQWKAQRGYAEEYAWQLSILRFLAHLATNELGYPAQCSRPACRRAGACVGDRNEHDWSFPGPWMPPCASTYRKVEEVRARVCVHIDAMGTEEDGYDAA